MSVRALVVAQLALAIAPRVALADGPTGPSQVLASCRAEPHSALCREVRRLCATGEVRPDVVPVCKELGWYGETQASRLVNLCPLDPTHDECVAMKTLCEEHRAEEAGLEGPGICRQLGWGEYAYARLPSESEEAGDGDLGGLAGGVHTPQPARVEDDVRGSPGPTLHPPVSYAGTVGVGFQLGLVDEGLDFADNERTYGALISWNAVSFGPLPLAAAVDVSVGGGSARGFVYDLAALGGLGHFFPGVGAVGLVGGAAIEGIDGDDGVTPAVRLPLRLFGISHMPGLTATLWGQVAWQVAGEDRAVMDERPAAIDAVSLGATVVLGRRSAANEPKKPRLFVGGSYEERGAARLFLLVLGFGAAQEPWNL